MPVASRVRIFLILSILASALRCDDEERANAKAAPSAPPGNLIGVPADVSEHFAT